LGQTLLITGACGFAGKALIEGLLSVGAGYQIVAVDNLSRPGSEQNRSALRALGIRLIHADVRSTSDTLSFPRADWVIEAAANPSVLAGVGAGATSRQLYEHNLLGSLQMLEYCRQHGAGFVLISSSRVYSIPALCSIPLRARGDSFVLDESAPLAAGLSSEGIGPDFSTAAPVSLYGGTKLASEIMALEYGEAFGFPVWVNRCGVLAGAGQFGTAGQGIFAYWINAHLRRRALRYIGFDGTGKQARDAFHPHDLAALIHLQMQSGRRGGRRVYTAGGGIPNTMSLAELTAWCDARFGPHAPASDRTPRPYDVPWVAMDSTLAAADFGWRVERPLPAILDEIAAHAEAHPDWLELSEAS
jgi:CDP-paratose 2-epimerase